MQFDEYTRWQCPKCGAAGVDSWNKALFDGIDHDDDLKPHLPHLLGLECDACSWPLVIRYDGAELVPVAICGPVPFNAGAQCYAYEGAAFTAIETDRGAGIDLLPSDHRDKDWRGGCCSAPPQQKGAGA